MKDFWVSLAAGGLLGAVALVTMHAAAEAMPVIVAVALGVLGSIAVWFFRLGPGIRHLITGMERDRVEIAKATEELRRLVSRIREPNEIEMYGGQRLIPPFDARDKSSRARKES